MAEKFDVVIEAVRYKNGQILTARGYERRGATFSDRVLLDRKMIVDQIKIGIKTGGPLVMIGGALVRPALSGIRKMLDPSEYGAAILLGINGLVLIGHGRSDSSAIKNAIKLAKNAAESHMLAALRSAIESSLTP